MKFADSNFLVALLNPKALDVIYLSVPASSRVRRPCEFFIG